MKTFGSWTTLWRAARRARFKGPVHDHRLVQEVVRRRSSLKPRWQACEDDRPSAAARTDGQKIKLLSTQSDDGGRDRRACGGGGQLTLNKTCFNLPRSWRRWASRRTCRQTRRRRRSRRWRTSWARPRRIRAHGLVDRRAWQLVRDDRGGHRGAAQRLAGRAGLVGMSEAQLFGCAAALSSVGIEAEAGGSALSKVWSEIETMVATKTTTYRTSRRSLG